MKEVKAYYDEESKAVYSDKEMTYVIGYDKSNSLEEFNNPPALYVLRKLKKTGYTAEEIVLLHKNHML